MCCDFRAFSARNPSRRVPAFSVQWAAKVMSPTSMYFLWKQGSWLLWATVLVYLFHTPLLPSFLASLTRKNPSAPGGASVALTTDRLACRNFFYGVIFTTRIIVNKAIIVDDGFKFRPYLAGPGQAAPRRPGPPSSGRLQGKGASGLGKHYASQIFEDAGYQPTTAFEILLPGPYISESLHSPSRL